jgi:hypothetical protein
MAKNQVVESPHLPYSLIELSNVIAANARAYADNVNSNGESHSSNDFESLEAVRHSLISAAFKIITVAARPTEYLPNVAIQVIIATSHTQSRWLTIPADTTHSVSQVALSFQNP